MSIPNAAKSAHVGMSSLNASTSRLLRGRVRMSDRSDPMRPRSRSILRQWSISSAAMRATRH